jgi:enoyl-CoA hydratase/carnithine racemase
MSYQTIEVDISAEGVMTVTLNRPAVLNAFNNEMLAEFSKLYAQWCWRPQATARLAPASM